MAPHGGELRSEEIRNGDGLTVSRRRMDKPRHTVGVARRMSTGLPSPRRPPAMLCIEPMHELLPFAMLKPAHSPPTIVALGQSKRSSAGSSQGDPARADANVDVAPAEDPTEDMGLLMPPDEMRLVDDQDRPKEPAVPRAGRPTPRKRRACLTPKASARASLERKELSVDDLNTSIAAETLAYQALVKQLGVKQQELARLLREGAGSLRKLADEDAAHRKQIERFQHHVEDVQRRVSQLLVDNGRLQEHINECGPARAPMGGETGRSESPPPPASRALPQAAQEPQALCPGPCADTEPLRAAHHRRAPSPA